MATAVTVFVDVVAGEAEESHCSIDRRLGLLSLVFFLVELRHYQLQEFADVVYADVVMA